MQTTPDPRSQPTAVTPDAEPFAAATVAGSSVPPRRVPHRVLTLMAGAAITAGGVWAVGSRAGASSEPAPPPGAGAPERPVTPGELLGDVLSALVTPDPAAPDTVTPDTVAPDTVAPDTVAPDTVAPDTVAPDTVAPDTSVAPMVDGWDCPACGMG